jgi:hypothetical protein
MGLNTTTTRVKGILKTQLYAEYRGGGDSAGGVISRNQLNNNPEAAGYQN